MEGDGTMKDINMNISKEALKIIAFVLLFLIIAGVFVWYVAIPKYNEIQQLNAEIAKQEDHLNLLLLAQSKITTINNDINNFTIRIANLQKVLPPERDEFLYGEEVLALANTSNVTVTSMQFPKQSGTNASGQNVDFSLNIESSNLANITKFIDALKNFPQITELSNLNISKAQSLAGAVQSPAYSVNMKGIIYLSQRK
jgi:Tfp pilus assembly protein PilO